jgi:hypothetical protein
MPLLAESLVEEWLNRNGYFTIRGVKHGLGEMDLLAVRRQSDGVVGRHVEVTVGFRPIGYIAPERLRASRRKGRYVRRRTLEQIEVCARAYVNAKFRAPDKVQLRTQLWSGVTWSFHWFMESSATRMSWTCSCARVSFATHFMSCFQICRGGTVVRSLVRWAATSRDCQLLQKTPTML